MDRVKKFIQNPTVRRYARSTAVTFVGVFIPAFSLAYAESDLQTVTLSAALAGALVSATRLGVKAVLETWAGQL